VKKGKTQREMDEWCKTEHDKPWTERRGTRDRDRWQNFVLVKENHCRVDKSLDDDDVNDDDVQF
jgi:hypothetical protein